jgi:hypothetical protein
LGNSKVGVLLHRKAIADIFTVVGNRKAVLTKACLGLTDQLIRAACRGSKL